jgi:CRP-like cAMP-binding protein
VPATATLPDGGCSNVSTVPATYAALPGVDIARSLRQASLFQSLDEDARADLAARGRLHVCARGTSVTPDAAPDCCYLIVRGSVRFFLLSGDGRKITLGEQRAGEVFWLAHSNQFPFAGEVENATPCAEVLDDRTVLCTIPYQHVRRLMAAYPSFTLALAEQIYRWNVEFCGRIWELANDSVITRLAHTLARLARENGEHVVTDTHDELAWWVGTSRARVTKELHRLRSLGCIEYRPHQHAIQVLNPEQLRSLELSPCPARAR